MLRKIFKILRNLLICLLLLVAGGYFAIKIPAVQTWLSQRIASYMSKELNTRVSIGGVEVDLWATFTLRDLYIEDQLRDTLVFFPTISLRNYSYDRDMGNVVINNIDLEQPYFNLVRHEGQTVLNYKFILDYFDVPTDTLDTTHTQVYLNNIKIAGGRFNYINENRALRETFGIDWNHIQTTGFDLTVSGMTAVGDSVHANIEHMALNETTGFQLEDLVTDLYIINGQTRLQDAFIKTSRSEIHGELVFAYTSLDDFMDVEHKVKMNHNLERSLVNMDELAYFSSSLKGYDKVIEVSGRIKGTVSDLKGRKIDIRLDDHTSFRGNFDMEGLPEIDETFISMDIDELTTNKTELDRLQLPPYDSLHYLHTPANYAQLGQITYRGNFTGFINDFVSYGSITTAIGVLKTDLSLKEDTLIDDYRFTGKLGMVGFDLGKFYSSSDLGPLSCDLRVEGKGLQLEDVDAKFDGQISNLYLNGYNYSGITADGAFRQRAFSGNFNINDPNVSMDFDGTIDFTQKEPLLHFDADIHSLNLKEVHILEKYEYSAVSGNVHVISRGFDFDHFEGEVILEDITYCSQEKDYSIKYLELISTRDGVPKITLESDIATAEIKGEFNISELGMSLFEIASQIVPSFTPPEHHHIPQNFTMELKVADFTQISEIFLPDLHIAKNTDLGLIVNEADAFFEITLASDSISYKGNAAEGITVDIRRPDESFYITVLSDRINTSGSLEFEDFALDARTDNDTIYTALAWGNDDSMHSGDINGKLTVIGYNKYDFLFNQSSLTAKDEKWNFKPDGRLSLDSTAVTMNNFELYRGDQHLRANGKISKDPKDTLSIEVVQFDLASLNPFIGGNTKFYGVVNGTASVRDLYKDLIFDNDITLNDFKLNDYYVGNLAVRSSWDKLQQRLRIDGMLEKNMLNGDPLTRYVPLSFAGYYKPYDEKSPLDITATVNELDLGFINEFMSPGIMEMSGYASATMSITGQPEAPQLQADALLKDASIYINYLNCRYYIEEKLGVEPDMFTFNHIPIHDQEGHNGFLTGQMLHNNFADWNFDLFVEMEEPMLTLNTNEDTNPDYYGKAYTTGSVGISGYGDQLEFECNLRTERGSTLSMPMGNTSEQTFENFIRFVNAGDTLKEPALNLSGIKLNMQIEVTPEMEFQIIFDESVGDVMRGRGKGHISMEINTVGTFNMYGLVELTKGNYLFTLKNLINKEFQVKPGSTIAWYGDPFAADLDVQAIYKVNASLYDLIPDPSYQNGQRVPIDLEMKLTGKMLNPGVDFGITLPTVDQVTRSRVNAAISTEQERNRQAFALLVLRRFVSPPNVSTEHNSTNALAANSSELLSNQISNWLSQISDDFNLGFNYRPGDDISNEEIALALSTQLFNERVAISSNLGVSRNTNANTTSSQNTNNLIGDIRIEYKITAEGRIRLVVYNESNDYRMAYTQQSPYTQGVGVIYRAEFDTFDEFLDGFRGLLKKPDAANP